MSYTIDRPKERKIKPNFKNVLKKLEHPYIAEMDPGDIKKSWSKNELREWLIEELRGQGVI